MTSTLCKEEWNLVKTLLPPDLEASAKSTLAIRRAREIKDADSLLRLLFLHVAGGLSLEQTVYRATQLGFAKMSAVVLFKRLRGARAWLEYLCAQLIAEHATRHSVDWPFAGRNCRVLDASDIREPGATGSSWRLHYSIMLPTLRCDFAKFTPCTTGERLQNMPVEKGDLILADRAYGKRAQVAWLMESGADACIRLHPPAFPAHEQNDAGDADDETDIPLDWLAMLNALPATSAGEKKVHFKHQKKTCTVRICAIRKSATAAEQARHKITIEARKKGRKLRDQTLQMADYIVILTTLPAAEVSAAQVLELYRCRWQVELAFKRLKSLLAMSAVPKTDEQSARSWMQAKLLESLLIERLLEQSRALSPWGYKQG